MNNRRVYEIAFVGLKPGEHTFTYSVNDEFFAPYGQMHFSNVQAQVILRLEKHSGFLMLHFDVGGKAEVICDRCGNTVTADLWDEFKMIVKLVDNPEEMNDKEEDPDVFYLSRTESHLFTGDWVYEFVTLSVPLQYQCPDNGTGPQCNQEVIAKLNSMLVNEEAPKPIWKGLDKITGLED